MARPQSIGEPKVNVNIAVPPELLAFLLVTAVGRGQELGAYMLTMATQSVSKMPFDVPGEEKPIPFDEMSPSQKEAAGKAILEKLGIEVKEGKIARA